MSTGTPVPPPPPPRPHPLRLRNSYFCSSLRSPNLFCPTFPPPPLPSLGGCLQASNLVPSNSRQITTRDN